MHAAAFIAKWRRMELKERSASQSHFIDLCAVLGVPTPTEADPKGDFYAFERGAKKSDGGDGWADVWFRGHFAWEYKGQRADLRAAPSTGGSAGTTSRRSSSGRGCGRTLARARIDPASTVP